jgi:hypothetical protein
MRKRHVMCVHVFAKLLCHIVFSLVPDDEQRRLQGSFVPVTLLLARRCVPSAAMLDADVLCRYGAQV